MSNRTQRATGTHTVAALIYDGISVFELGIVAEVFGVKRQDLQGLDYRLRVCAPRPGMVRTSAGFSVAAPYGPRALLAADTVVVIPGLCYVNRSVPDDLLSLVRRAHARGARVVSLCVGAFVLAAAGLLDGRPATTHWRHVARLRARFPAVRVQPEVLFVDDGKVLTSAGAAAGLDLCLHLVRRDHGAQLANRLARRIVVAPVRDGGQAQYIEQPVPPRQAGEIGEVLRWSLDHLGRPLSLPMLARRAGMSPRTFARRFVEATGTSPHRWILGQRILLAQRWLEADPALSIDVVAERCGFTDVAAFRRQFRRRLVNTPSGYRRAFQRGTGRESAEK